MAFTGQGHELECETIESRVEKLEKSIPKAIYSGELKIGGITLKCHVLEDHTPIIEAESLFELLSAMGNGTFMPTEQESIELAKFWRR